MPELARIHHLFELVMRDVLHRETFRAAESVRPTPRSREERMRVDLKAACVGEEVSEIVKFGHDQARLLEHFASCGLVWTLTVVERSGRQLPRVILHTWTKLPDDRDPSIVSLHQDADVSGLRKAMVNLRRFTGSELDDLLE